MAVILYIRFSSAAQADGDSVDRQRRLAAAYCAEHNLTITREITALGESAYRGKNLKKIHELIREAEAGTIEPGSTILIENLDRLSRANITMSMPVLLALVKADIDVVTLTDKKRYSKKTIGELPNFLTSALELFRANAESERKSDSVKSSREKARQSMNRNGFACPGWLRKTTAGLEPIPELVASIQRVFEHVAAGHGSKATAVKANQEGWPVPSTRPKGGWHHSLVTRLIRGKAVLGQHQHHVIENGVRRPEGSTIYDWYPAVIDIATYDAANRSMDSRPYSSGRHSDTAPNPLRGRIVCGICNHAYAYHPGQYAAYFCRGRARGVCTSPQVAQRRILEALIPGLVANWQEYFKSGSARKSAEQRLSRLSNELLTAQDAVQRYTKAIATAPDVVSIAEALSGHDATRRSLEHEIWAAEAALEAMPDGIDFETEEVLDAFKEGGDVGLRRSFAEHLHRLVERVVVYPNAGLVIFLTESERVRPLVLPLGDRNDRVHIETFEMLMQTHLL